MSEFPENRPRDMNKVPLPTPLEAEQERIKNARIEREQAQIRDAISKQPTAGHHDLDDDRGRARGRRR